MSVDKDSSLESESSAIGRPPAVRERLWAMIPDDRRMAYVRHAAQWLRRGVHPEDAIASLLVSDGFPRHEVDAAMEDVPAPDVAEAVEPELERRDEPSGPLLWPYGSSGFECSSVPAGRIGERLQSACGMSPEGAASVEWRILRAVARDPSFVVEDVSHVRFLGCDIAPAHLSAVGDLIEIEARLVESDVRARQSRGDETAMDWIDPRDPIFGAFESST